MRYLFGGILNLIKIEKGLDLTLTYDKIFKNGLIFTPNGLEKGDIAVKDGKIDAIGSFYPTQAEEVIDCDGLTILPGVIDTQVHFREPGAEHKEDLHTGSAQAVAGGVTAVFEMPNTNPTTTSAADFNDKLRRAEGRMYCDHAFYVGATADNAEILPELEVLPGCAGVKIFMGSSTGGLLVSDDNSLRRVLANGRRRVAVHAEDEERLLERKSIAEEGAHPRVHPVWRDVESAFKATRRIVKLARETRRKTHILHISTAEEVAFLAGHKDLISAEVLANHLTLAAPDCYERSGTLAQMNPPIREASHREALWRGVREGLFDAIATDHAPHTPEEKAKPYPQSPAGIVGVQTFVPIMLEHVRQGRLTLARFVDATASAPARLFGLKNKGRIAVGYDADLTVIDMKASFVIRGADLHSKSKHTPYEGLSVTGKPVMTVVRGAFAMREGTLADKPFGKPLDFDTA